LIPDALAQDDWKYDKYTREKRIKEREEDKKQQEGELKYIGFATDPEHETQERIRYNTALGKGSKAGTALGLRNPSLTTAEKKLRGDGLGLAGVDDSHPDLMNSKDIKEATGTPKPSITEMIRNDNRRIGNCQLT
jgi:hypothetical protein